MSIHSSENFSDARGPGRHAWCGLLLAIVPGFGQFYHRQWLKGLFFLVLLSSFLGIFYDFLREGLWGLYTLGEEVPRDNSIFLLAEGIISVLIVAFGVLIYFLSLRDAWLNGKKRDEGIALNSVRKQYQMLLSDGFPYLMITPGFILLVFVVIFPILFGFAIAFTNYNLYHTPPAKLVDWVGLKNFINIFTLSIWRSTFLDVLQWTVVWTLLATTLQCTVGVLLAILVNQKDLRFKPLIRTIFILPWAVPGFVTILVFAGMFNDSFGVINNAILSFFGISPKAWLTDPFWTKTALIMMQTWLGFPFVFAMTTGVLQAIPDDLYEAATMDGASAFTRLRTITLPLVLYAIAPIIITQYTFNFNNFNIIYLFNNGGPAVAGSNAGGTDILVSWIYKLTMSSSQYAIAATITILLSIFVVGLALWQFRATKSFKNDDMA
ncbi:carbohydrate ABC transporter permease [Klebsiella pneumoniae]|uniref:carbohydrate ABC transporter permease n=1 Tax=Klebsiella pneumoniae TaxID=573 RepID=UPI00351018E3